MKDLAAKGGVVQINYHVWLSEPGIPGRGKGRSGDQQGHQRRSDETLRRHMRAASSWKVTALHGNTSSRAKLPRVDFAKIIEHIDHAVEGGRRGPRGPGFGLRRAANMPYGMEDATKLPRITEGLLQKRLFRG